MCGETFALFTTLSRETINPRVTDRAMHNLWKANIHLSKRVLTVNLMKMMLKNKIGTNDVMQMAKAMSRSSFSKGSEQRYSPVCQGRAVWLL